MVGNGSFLDALCFFVSLLFKTRGVFQFSLSAFALHVTSSMVSSSTWLTLLSAFPISAFALASG